MYYLGAHVSITGGLHNAVAQALSIGANAFALFTKNQKQWKVPPLEPEQINEFKNALVEGGFTAPQVLAHDGYLINLGNPSPEKRRLHVEAFIDEMQRAMLLGLDRLNFHPGAHLNLVSPEDCMHLIAEGIDEALDQTEGVSAVIETTAGQGTALGKTFEEIARILDLCRNKDRIGVCIDTCHIHAAGYRIVSPEDFLATMEEYDRILGFEKLMGMHLNDAKSLFASHVDRHAPLGQGSLGIELFRCIMADNRFENIPLILETTDPELWSNEISLLRSFETNPHRGGTT